MKSGLGKQLVVILDGFVEMNSQLGSGFPILTMWFVLHVCFKTGLSQGKIQPYFDLEPIVTLPETFQSIIL